MESVLLLQRSKYFEDITSFIPSGRTRLPPTFTAHDILWRRSRKAERLLACFSLTLKARHDVHYSTQPPAVEAFGFWIQPHVGYVRVKGLFASHSLAGNEAVLVSTITHDGPAPSETAATNSILQSRPGLLEAKFLKGKRSGKKETRDLLFRRVVEARG